MKNRGSSLTSVVLAVAAAVGVGVGGYFVLGGECTSCETETAAATTVAATEEGESCCDVEGAAVETVAMEGESCCDAEAKADCDAATECADKADCDSATECADKTDCETACSAEGMAETVALEGEACSTATDCADKTDCDEATECEDKTDCEGEVCPVTGEPVELTDAEDGDNGNG